MSDRFLRRFWLPLLLSFCLALSLGTSSFARQQTLSANWSNASFPVEQFQRYSSPFGYRSSPRGGGREFHRGLDLAAPLGSYIRNWWAGQVVELSDTKACGTLIAIQSGAWKHIYCHLQGSVERDRLGLYLTDPQGGILLRQGQTLPTGARIGRVGLTGRTTGPHLHWGIKYQEQYIDPARVLQAMSQQQ